MAGEIQRTVQAFGNVAAFDDGGEIEDGKDGHVVIMPATGQACGRRVLRLGNTRALRLRHDAADGGLVLPGDHP